MTLQLNTYLYTVIVPAQVSFRLTDGFSTFDFGPQRVMVPRGNLDQVRVARELAQHVAAQAAFWDRDLAAIEDQLVAAEQEEANRRWAPAAHTPPAPEVSNGTGMVTVDNGMPIVFAVTGPDDLGERAERALARYESLTDAHPEDSNFDEDLTDEQADRQIGGA